MNDEDDDDHDDCDEDDDDDGDWADAMERRANGGYTPPASTVPESTTVSTVIHASILDRGTIVQIEAAIAKALRERSERGGLPLGVKNS